MQDNQTIKAYDKYAEVYDGEVIDFWANFPLEFIDKFVASLPGKCILNLGSGSGRDAMLLKNRGLDVLCVDASKSMIGMTSAMGFESLLSSFSELDFPENSFDGVWAYTSLIHIPKEEAREIISKVYTWLRPGGGFAIGVINGERSEMVDRKTMPGTSRYFKDYRSDELKELVETASFKFVGEQEYRPHNSVYLSQLYRKD